MDAVSKSYCLASVFPFALFYVKSKMCWGGEKKGLCVKYLHQNKEASKEQ